MKEKAFGGQKPWSKEREMPLLLGPRGFCSRPGGAWSLLPGLWLGAGLPELLGDSACLPRAPGVPPGGGALGQPHPHLILAPPTAI